MDYTHVMLKGRLVKIGGPELVEKINKHGFEQFYEEMGDETA